jgi:hypothetical protein
VCVSGCMRACVRAWVGGCVREWGGGEAQRGICAALHLCGVALCCAGVMPSLVEERKQETDTSQAVPVLSFSNRMTFMIGEVY